MSLQSTIEYDWRYILQQVTESSCQLFNQEGGSKKCAISECLPLQLTCAARLPPTRTDWTLTSQEKKTQSLRSCLPWFPLGCCSLGLTLTCQSDDPCHLHCERKRVLLRATLLKEKLTRQVSYLFCKMTDPRPTLSQTSRQPQNSLASTFRSWL